jgi:hypothetical protein
MARVTAGASDTIFALELNEAGTELSVADPGFASASTIQFATTDEMVLSTTGGFSTNSGVGVDRVWLMGGSAESKTDTYYEPESASDDDSNALPGWAIALIILGSLLFFGAIFAWYYYETHKKEKLSKPKKKR